MLSVGLGAPLNVQTNEHDADENTSASLKERYFFSSFNASCACPSNVPVHIRQCVCTVCRYLLFCRGFSEANSHLGIPARSERRCVCICVCVCASTLCPTWTKANRFFRVCVPVLSWNQVFSLTPPSMKDGRISQEQVGCSDGDITTALPHFCALSDYTEATGGPDLKVAADCLWMWHSRPESRAADQPSFHIIRISPHVEQRDAKDDGW